MSNKKQSIRYKIVIVGDSAVGKSCIATRYISDDFYEFQEPTIGASFMIKNLNINGKDIKLEIWDTAGQERYRSLAPMYYRNSNVALVVYDVTKKSSFDSAKIWIDEINRKSTPGCIIVLLGNKYDLDKEIKVNENEINAYIEQKNIMHFKTSAKTGLNINNLFNTIIKKLLEENNNGIIKKNIFDINNEIKQDRKCC
tara:strand:- start:171 stop:764 length:594 start_codon:yes stop_codon:yes gene_type:complete